MGSDTWLKKGAAIFFDAPKHNSALEEQIVSPIPPILLSARRERSILDEDGHQRMAKIKHQTNGTLIFSYYVLPDVTSPTFHTYFSLRRSGLFSSYALGVPYTRSQGCLQRFLCELTMFNSADRLFCYCALMAIDSSPVIFSVEKHPGCARLFFSPETKWSQKTVRWLTFRKQYIRKHIFRVGNQCSKMLAWCKNN